MKKITTIINYCTNDYIFLKSCIDNVRPFSHEIIIPYCDHFHDGTQENKSLQEKSVLENTGVQFVEFAYENTKSSRWHCNISRKIGIELASTDTEYFLFLDTDEIVESEKFIAWVNEEEKNGILDSYKIAHYWYFRDFKFRSKTWEDNTVFVKKGPITENDDFIFHEEERKGMFWFVPQNRRRAMATYNGSPFVHHYSWVRSKEAMLKKVSCWSHNKDQDWVSLVHKEFELPFRGKDMIFRDREYDIVEPYINIPIENN
jgi:hypothetical protein